MEAKWDQVHQILSSGSRYGEAEDGDLGIGWVDKDRDQGITVKP